LSTKAAFRFVDNLVHSGTVLVSDDWHDFDSIAGVDGGKNFGEQKAFLEWGLREEFGDLFDSEQARAFVMR
jgi:hypothetical protein